MYGLTICQPYAELIASGEKRVENRTWSTAYRGPVAIHAGKSRAWLRDEDKKNADLVFGAVVAVGLLTDCVKWRGKNTVLPKHLHWMTEHAHCEGPYSFVLSDVHRMEVPIPCTGKQGFWFLPDDVARMAGAEFHKAMAPEERESAEEIGRILIARGTLGDPQRPGRGSVPCPICGEGHLRYVVHENGHIWAKCTTEGCVSWVE